MMRGKIGGGVRGADGWFPWLMWILLIGSALTLAKNLFSQEATNAPTMSRSRREIEDLGVMTERTAINLEKCERRKDFASFRVEVMPRNKRGWTNKVSFTTTNAVLTLADFSAVPDGVAILGIRSVCSDATVSPLALFRIDIQRDAPDAPRATKSLLMVPPASMQRLEHVLESRKEGPDTTPPPVPPGLTVPTNSAANLELPGGTNETYSAYQARLEKLAASGQRLKNNR